MRPARYSFTFCGWGTLVAAAVLVMAASQTSAAADPQGNDAPVASRQSAFTIPFEISPARNSSEQPLEVQLFISSNRGASWKIYGRQPPSARTFPFRAERDGEYWFASRTVDQRGRTRPSGAFQPELRVVVDTAPPKLDLDAEIGAAGEIHTRWHVLDENLDLESFQLHYQSHRSKPWKAVSVGRQPSGTPRDTISGQITWWPEDRGQSLYLRAEVRDRAGNTTVANRTLMLPTRTGPAPAETARNTYLDPKMSESAPRGGGNIPWPVDRTTTRSPVQENRRDQPHHSLAGKPSPAVGPPPRYQEITSIRSQSDTGNGRGPSGQLVGTNQYRVQSAGNDPAVGEEQRTLDNSAAQHQESGGGQLPPGERPRMTNLRRFILDYDVSSVGPSGVAKVQLWGTRDGGQTWTRWGQDDDRQSPLTVDVPGEGTYGFRVVIESGNGLIGRLPSEGDMADVWVGVDLTRPTARLVTATYGSGDHAGELDIRWEAGDRRLGPRPVSLSFSDRPGGPWTTIASGLPNSGQYQWQVDNRVPRQIFLRLQVRDEAGNIATDALQESIANDGLVPQGRIRSFRPANDIQQ